MKRVRKWGGVVVRAAMSGEGRPGSAGASMGCREKASGTRRRRGSTRSLNRARKLKPSMGKVDGVYHRRRCSDGLTAGAAERRAMNEVG